MPNIAKPNFSSASKLRLLAAPLALAASFAIAEAAADPVADFYKGKSIDLIIGFTQGGGYDVYARTVMRHMTNHIPGEPAVVPKQMTGAGSRKAAAYVYNVAPKDGTVIGAIFGGGITQPLLGDAKAIQHDPTKFIYLGSANREVSLCIARSDAAKSFDAVMKEPITLGASAAGGTSRDFPAALSNVLGAKFNIVSGYPGTKEIGLAVERNEVHGFCGYFLSSLMTQNPSWLTDPNMTILVQEVSSGQGSPILNERGVPIAAELAKTPEDRQVLELIFDQLVFGRPYILPPGVPSDRVAVLRKAFMESLKDPALLADAKKSRIDIDAVSGEEVQALVAKMFATPEAVVKRAREAQVPKK